MISKKSLALSAVTLSLTFSLAQCPQSFAADSKSEPTIEELKNSKDRGLFIEPPVRKQVKVEVRKTPVSKVEIAKPVKVSVVKPKVAPVAKVVKGSQISKVSKPATTAIKPAVKLTPVAHAAKSVQHSKSVTQKALPVVSNQPDSGHKIVKTNVASDIIKAWLNKPGNSPKYRDGDKMEVNVTANQDCNLSIFDYDGKGKLTQIFPNEYQPVGMVKSGETVTIGGADSKFEYLVSTAPGESKANEHIFVFAYPVNESPISIAMNTAPDSPFRSADITLEQYRKLVNESKVYFSREVKIVPKGHIKQVSNETAAAAPNKVELSFEIEK